MTRPGGLLSVALYNDAGGRSRRWVTLKRTYNSLPSWLRPTFAALTIVPMEVRMMLGALARFNPREYIERWTKYGDTHRGMTKWRDVIDWVGGYPYEYARVDEIFHFYRERGYVLRNLACSKGPLGCNEFVFERPVATKEVR
jgi:2-polyprenyl-6-hydroxyphenyl methylase/3-demethylubiquinone-9 3-methyltransferase